MKQEKSSERNYDKYFKKFLANFSEYEIIWRVFCFGSVPFDWSHPVIISRRQNSNDLELIIASPYGDSISFVWKPPVVVQLSNIKEILVGKVFHTEFKGTYSTQAELMRIEFILENGEQYSRYLEVGTSEKQKNQNRPNTNRALEELNSIYPISIVPDSETSAGLKTSFGFLLNPGGKEIF